MSSRLVLAGLALCTGLAVSSAADAQYGRSYGGGQWDCNASRCIDRSTGALWESHCDRGGCVPLRPARQRGYGGSYGGGYGEGYGGGYQQGYGGGYGGGYQQGYGGGYDHRGAWQGQQCGYDHRGAWKCGTDNNGD